MAAPRTVVSVLVYSTSGPGSPKRVYGFAMHIGFPGDYPNGAHAKGREWLQRHSPSAIPPSEWSA